ncbi:MAG: ABC transporter ATP-binding protein [Salinisphaeraceae bacterium]|nr:ABC transporter ATP-binding protein [Salinisphaeraceae bacterium]
MRSPVLSVEDLRTHLKTPDGRLRAVDGISLNLRAGETVALLGESGCGKSMTALSLMRLVPQPAGIHAGGRILLGQGDAQVDLLGLPEVALRRIRGKRIGMIFQEPMSALNPVLSVGEQIAEVLRLHRGLDGAVIRQAGIDLLNEVGMPDPARRWQEYPHQLSGGLKQRVVIAIALAGEPEVLIADEPTTALDVTIQAQILDLLARIQRERGMAMLLITHDLAVVADVADRVAVMYAGRIVELAPRDELFSRPRHPYTRALFRSLPGPDRRGGDLSVIPGTVPPLTQTLPACHFADRCRHAWSDCRARPPAWQGDAQTGVLCHLYDPDYPDHPPPDDALEETPDAGNAITDSPAPADAGPAALSLKGIRVHFPIQKGVFKRTVGHVYAVDGVSLDITPGQTLALVGESGCGKTTLGRAAAQLIRPTEGRIQLGGSNLTDAPRAQLKRSRSDLQMIFQDPFSSMNPRLMVGDIIAEGMQAQGLGGNAEKRRQRAAELLEQVGMTRAALDRYPHEFSGGQRQRICIARALAVDPKVIICDEPTSALDVSVQAQVLNLMQRLQRELGLSYLFITHNMAVVAYMAHEVAVMYLGRIVEQGRADEILDNPRHPYTQALLSATPSIREEDRREIIRLKGDLPSPSHPPAGCHFAPRCPQVMDACRRSYPDARHFSDTHSARCLLYPKDG